MYAAKAARKHNCWARVNFYVKVRPSIDCLYFIYACANADKNYATVEINLVLVRMWTHSQPRKKIQHSTVGLWNKLSTLCMPSHSTKEEAAQSSSSHTPCLLVSRAFFSVGKLISTLFSVLELVIFTGNSWSNFPPIALLTYSKTNHP